MATILNPKNKDPNEQQNQPIGAGPQQVSGGQPSEVGGAPQQAQGTKSGRFTNVSNYLKANQGFNQQGGGLAGKVAGNIQNQGEQVKQGVGQAQNQFGQESQAGRRQFDEGTVNNALANPSDFSNNQQNVDKFQQQLNAKYSGPQGLQNANVLQNQAINLQNLTKNTGTEGGRFGLLKQMFNKPTYTGGQQKLDNLLLQGNQSQLNKLTGTRQLGNQVVSNVGQATQAAQQAAGQYGQEAADTASKTQEALTGGVSSFDKSLEDKAAEAQNNRDLNFSQAQMGADEGYINQDVLDNSQLGDQNIYNLNLQDYLKKNDTGATKQNVAESQDYNRINALKKLSGDYSNPNLSDVFSQYSNPELAGQFKAGGDYTLDSAGLKAAASERGNELAKVQQLHQNSINEAQDALSGANSKYGAGGIQANMKTQAQALRDAYGPKINPLTKKLENNANTPGMPDLNSMTDEQVLQTLTSGGSNNPFNNANIGGQFNLDTAKAGGNNLMNLLNQYRGQQSAEQDLMNKDNERFKSTRKLVATPQGMKFAPKTETGQVNLGPGSINPNINPFGGR